MNKSETRGRKALSFADRVANVPLRLYPREIEEIKRCADAEGISAMAWKRRAIRASINRSAAMRDVEQLRDEMRAHLASDRVGRIVCNVSAEAALALCERILGERDAK